MAEIIDGKLVSSILREELKKKITCYKEETGKNIGLAVVVVGNDPASAVYVRNKHRACEQVGIESFQIELAEDTTEAELLSKIDELNTDDSVNGILVQLPLPKHINETRVIENISPIECTPCFLT